MKTVWKFPIEPADHFTLEMPADAEILDIQVQHREVQLWALVNPKAKLERRVFRLAGTGHPIEEGDELRYVASFQLHNGDLVFHVFEVTP